MRKKKKKERIRDIRQIQKLRREKKEWQTAAPVSGFKSEYCRMLIDHCSEGHSFQSFAAQINVLPETLEKWTKEYPEFETARQEAEFKQKMYWETMALEACRAKFSVNVFRYFIGIKQDLKSSEPQAVVLLPKEEEESK